jgi:dTDP-4-dehydrorhamnose reductase
MKVLVVGCNGQLGHDMVTGLRTTGYEVVETDYPDIDITKFQNTFDIVHSCKPEVIINCAAFTAVDNCETQSETAFAINATGSENLAKCAESTDARLIHFSTDYVFDGKAQKPYIESDETLPMTTYGKSKLEGEKAIASTMERYQIFRIAWLYGIHGNNFVKTIINTAPKKIQNKEPFKVVHDQYGTPTSTIEVCRQVLEVMNKDLYGIFHSTCEGSCTWYDFTREIVKTYNLPVDVLPCTTDEYPRPAPRPRYSVLENAYLKTNSCNVMKDWQTAFNDFWKSYKSI